MSHWTDAIVSFGHFILLEINLLLSFVLGKPREEYVVQAAL